MKGIIHRHQTA